MWCLLIYSKAIIKRDRTVQNKPHDDKQVRCSFFCQKEGSGSKDQNMSCQIVENSLNQLSRYIGQALKHSRISNTVWFYRASIGWFLICFSSKLQLMKTLFCACNRKQLKSRMWSMAKKKNRIIRHLMMVERPKDARAHTHSDNRAAKEY